MKIDRAFVVHKTVDRKNRDLDDLFSSDIDLTNFWGVQASAVFLFVSVSVLTRQFVYVYVVDINADIIILHNIIFISTYVIASEL